MFNTTESLDNKLKLIDNDDGAFNLINSFIQFILGNISDFVNIYSFK